MCIIYPVIGHVPICAADARTQELYNIFFCSQQRRGDRSAPKRAVHGGFPPRKSLTQLILLMNSPCIIFLFKGMGTCDSGPGQRGKRSADCHAQCREVTMLAPVAVTTRWCGRCPGLFHQIPAPSSTPRIGSVVAMSGRMWKAPCRRRGRNIYSQAGSPPHTRYLAKLLEPASRCHESSLPSSFPRVSLPVAAQAGYFRRTLGRILPCIAAPSVHPRGAAHST